MKFVKQNKLIVILPALFAVSIAGKTEDRDAKAVIIEADSATPKAAGDPQTRLFTSDPTLNSAIAGVGIGVVGSLIVGALLDAKHDKACHPVYRRDTASARFLPGLTGKKCPPVGYPQPGYPQPGYPQPGYTQPGYPAPTPVHHTGYPVPQHGYPAQQHGYPAPQPAYPATGYQPAAAYNNNYRPAQSYPKPTPAPVYPPNQSYPARPSSSYNPSPVYVPASSGYNRPVAASSYNPTNYPPSPSYQPAGYSSGYRAPTRSAKSLNTPVVAASSAGPAEFGAGIKAMPGAKDGSAVKFG